MNILSVPNIITLCRLLMAPIAVWLIIVGDFFWAFTLFCTASLSDALDGFIARAFKARTLLGSYLDPIADKSLLTGVYVALGIAGYLPAWLVILVVFRDLLIVGGILLFYTLRQSFSMRPLIISKINTLMQLGLAGWVLGMHGLSIPDMGITQTLVWLTGATTALSGTAYLRMGLKITNGVGRQT